MPAQHSILPLNMARDLSRRLRHLDEVFAAWTNLGGAVTATNFIMGASDGIGSSGQKFYRVIMPQQGERRKEELRSRNLPRKKQRNFRHFAKS